MVQDHGDATLAEYCEYFGEQYNVWVCSSVMCIAKKTNNPRKKTLRSRQANTERVQKLRVEYWEKVKHIEVENLAFLDEIGVLLGLTRTHGSSNRGSRVYEFKPYY